MLSGFFEVFKAFIELLKYPVFLILGIVALFYILVFFNVIFGLVKGKRFKKGSYKKVKKRGFFKRLLIDLPREFTNDMFEKNPDFFKYQGLIIFEGRQGSGKTISAIHTARQMQREYEKAKCITNLNYKMQDNELKHWSQLVDYKNGIFGVIAFIDETQNWFSSNQSKNFPPEMLEVVTQNRKNRRVILGTAQNFYLLAKAIRSQATEVRRCSTYLGCLTIVRRFVPILDSDGNVKDWKRRGMYFFVHDKELRDSYDTYHVIHSLSNSGFQDRLIENENITNNLILIDNKKK